MSKNELIEKAVIDWQGEFKPICELVYEYLGPSTYSACEPDALFGKKVLFTRKEFNAAADRLRGKPDWKDAPDWACVVAQDSNGEWWFYDSVPRADKWSFSARADGRVHRAGSGKVIGDWKNTLEKRPEQKVEANESAGNWFERGELPPAGTLCEVEYSSAEIKKEFHKVIPVTYGKSLAIFEDVRGGEMAYFIKCCKFRPIRTEREKFIEAADIVIHNLQPGAEIRTEFLEALFDAGFKAPEQK